MIFSDFSRVLSQECVMWVEYIHTLYEVRGMVTSKGCIFSSFRYPYFRIQSIKQKHPTNEGDARHDDTEFVER